MLDRTRVVGILQGALNQLRVEKGHALCTEDCDCELFTRSAEAALMEEIARCEAPAVESVTN